MEKQRELIYPATPDLSRPSQTEVERALRQYHRTLAQRSQVMLRAKVRIRWANDSPTTSEVASLLYLKLREKKSLRKSAGLKSSQVGTCPLPEAFTLLGGANDYHDMIRANTVIRF